jgi:glutamine amidotransferase
MEIVIIDYGAGNVKSVQYALNRLGINPILSEDKEVILKADKVIFPGVGSAGAAMKQLQADGLVNVIPQLKQPVLGVCLGMQLMCNHSQEGDTKGLGIFDVDVVKFIGEEKIPHMGWNDLENLQSSLYNNFPIHNQVYFVHSYYVPVIPETTATCNYILPFSASIQKNNFYAFQFHPEKSSTAGEILLQNFLNI